MSNLLLSLLLYATTAVFAGAVLYRTGNAGLSWHPAEYALMLPGFAITALGAIFLSIFNVQFDIPIALILVSPGSGG